MPGNTRTYGSVKSPIQPAPRPMARATPALSAQSVLQKAQTGGAAGLSAAEIGVLHRTVGNTAVRRVLAAPTRLHRTGLPGGLKANIEQLSGVDLSAVRVHYDSAEPARVQALAYTLGADIHVAPGQERHLPHEAWHVVQQAQGRVLPTVQSKQGVRVNDDEGLEREADVMGARALHLHSGENAVTAKGRDAALTQPPTRHAGAGAAAVMQLFPAVIPKREQGAKVWTQAIFNVDNEADFNKFIKQLVLVSGKTGQDDPYTKAIAQMQDQAEKVTPGTPAWKDVSIRAVKAVLEAKKAGQNITEAEVKQAAKASVKAVQPVVVKPAINLADLLLKCQFAYSTYTKYNIKTGQFASCAVREFPTVGNASPTHATFFLDVNKETREVKTSAGMRAHLKFLHITVENSPATAKENSRYWPFDNGQFTGMTLTQKQQQDVLELWRQVRADLDKEVLAVQ